MSAYDPEAIVAALVSRLGADGTADRAVHEKGYLKSDLEHLGATVPHARAAAKALLAEHPNARADPWPLAEACWSTGIYELRSTMEFFLERAQLGPQALARLERLCRDCHTWALIDQLAVQVVPRAKPPAAMKQRWATDEDFWIRRVALLCDLKQLRAGKGNPAAWATLALPNLDHEEFFIRKALGWVLREIGKKNPAWTEAFVADHEADLSTLTRREATRNLPYGPA